MAPGKQQRENHSDQHAGYGAFSLVRDNNRDGQSCTPVRRNLSFKPCAGQEKCDGNDAANKGIREITEQPIPSFGKLSPDEKKLGPGSHGKRHETHDQDDYDARSFHCSNTQPKIATEIAVTSHPHPELISAPGIAASKLATHISGIAQPFISTTNNPAKYPGKMNLSASSNPGGKPSAIP